MDGWNVLWDEMMSESQQQHNNSDSISNSEQKNSLPYFNILPPPFFFERSASSFLVGDTTLFRSFRQPLFLSLASSFLHLLPLLLDSFLFSYKGDYYSFPFHKPRASGTVRVCASLISGHHPC